MTNITIGDLPVITLDDVPTARGFCRLNNNLFFDDGDSIDPVGLGNNNLIGYVKTSRKINNKALSADITLGLASTDFADQGTTTTVLHGNAAGAPSFASVTEADLTLADVTTLNATSSKHGLLPKLSNVATEFLNGAGSFAVPSSNFPDTIILPKTSGKGIKVDSDTPTFGWRDIIGDITPRAAGGTAPALTAFRGGSILSYAYAANDWIDQMVFHIPHDYVPGSDIFIHIHWGHNGTAISGTFEAQVYATKCKGFNQAGQTFGAEVNPTISEAVTDIASHPRWGHFVTEIALSSATGDSTHLNSSLIEVDSIILVSLKVLTIPTITGSATSNLPYIFTVDIHYQSTNMATKAKAPNFYV
jgi:hypothetical protein